MGYRRGGSSGPWQLGINTGRAFKVPSRLLSGGVGMKGLKFGFIGLEMGMGLMNV